MSIALPPPNRASWCTLSAAAGRKLASRTGGPGELLRAIACILSFLAPGSAASPAAPPPPFRDVTAASGIDFVHSNGASGTKQYKEVMGSGCALFDFDGDDLLDVYLVNSAGPNRLYRNAGSLRFEDVTERAGVADADGYGMGAAAADVDNDGDRDLFVTNYGPNRLFLNRGDGTFEERAGELGLDDPRWSAGSAFFDADADGWLDLYVVNYVRQAEPDTNECRGARGTQRLYCHPRMYPREPDVFYRNLGGGRFEDVTEAAGFGGVEGRGLGVIATDHDGDGWTDVYVANDLDPNFLFRNRGDGTFEEIAVLAGCAYNEDGAEESGMGVAAGDYDNDGRVDLFVTNFQNESNTLYHNEGDGLFFDRSAESGLGGPSLPYLGWGTDFVDFDLDGWQDLVVTNGHTESDIAEVDQLATWKQPMLLHRNRGDGSFELVSSSAAPDLAVARAGRGAAFGDLDNDGDRDIVLVNQRGAATLLENANANGNSWIGFRTRGADTNRDGVGWRIRVHFGGERRFQEVQAGGSYLSCNDPRVVFGLGRRTGPVRASVSFPHGAKSLDGLALNRYHDLDDRPDR
jgi:hypothetical protein